MWFVVSNSLRSAICLWKLGMCPFSENTPMKYDELKTCIDALKALHREKHQELGTSVSEELKAVVEEMEDCLQERTDEVEVPHRVSRRALTTLAQALSIVTNLATLAHLFFNYR
jgi:hypothetical protein